jgi:hypothetical protein
MTVERMIELLEIEKECVLRNASGECNRYCAGCDLIQDDTELHEMYTDAIALLKAQKPCLMDFSDIQTMSKVDVYLEDHGSDLVYPLMLLGAENSNKSQAVFFHPMTVKPLSAYGKTWRCWTCRPSQKQREETPWEGR